MKTNLFSDFTVDKDAKKVYITREFDAPLSLVWDAFTQKDILDQWTAPDPFKARSKYMNFEVGGKRFYAMVSPDGQENWILQTYTSITPKTNFKLFNTFADKDENAQPVGSDWDYTFSEENGITRVNITIYNESFERMQKMIEFGFKEGYTASIVKLEKLLETLKQEK